MPDRKKKRATGLMTAGPSSATAALVAAGSADFRALAEDARAAEKKAKKKAEKKSKSHKKKAIVKQESEDEEVGVEHTAEEKFWPEADLNELIRKIEITIPPKDTLRYDSRVERFNWDAVAFGDFSPQDCKLQWLAIQKRLRRYRLMRELIEDAKSWVAQPWTNFYRSQKQNRHPDQPRRPLSTYMIFYLEKKDKVAEENPKMEMTKVSKLIAEMYKNLTEKQKQKYVAKAQEQREQYEIQLANFYKMHPDQLPKQSKREKPSHPNYPGPTKPHSPFQLFLQEKLEKHKNDPNTNKASLTEHYREQWKELSDKKKMVWINAALEDDVRYQEELKTYLCEHPDFLPHVLKPLLTKEERAIKDRLSGKPEKPPNSGYSLFSRIMLQSDEIKHVDSKQRMTQISHMWKNLSPKDKRKYHDKVQEMLERYKLEFAGYLENLTVEQREEELKGNQRKKKPVVKKAKPSPSRGSKKKKEPEDDDEDDAESSEKDEDEVPPPKRKRKETRVTTTNKKGRTKANPPETANNSIQLFMGEPEPPPVMAYKLFLKKFMAESTHIPEETRLKEAPKYWQMLPDIDKNTYRKQLMDLKQKYIVNYEKFLKSLSQEQLKEYSLLKAKCTPSEEESPESGDSDAKGGGSDDDEEDNEGQDSDEQSESEGSSSGSASDTESSDSGSGSASESDSDSD